MDTKLAGAKGGKSTSDAKKKAARENGKKGGRKNSKYGMDTKAGAAGIHLWVNGLVDDFEVRFDGMHLQEAKVRRPIASLHLSRKEAYQLIKEISERLS